MSLWDSLSAAGKKAGDATKLAAHKTKLRTDMMMIDREITNTKKAFGVGMYDHVSPLSQSSDFYAATDDLTNILRPPLINAQKEIQALAAKRVLLKESLAAAEVQRAAAFPTKAESAGQKVMNFGKASYMYSGETKIKAELAIVDRQIKGHKQDFGLELFEVLEKAEDERGYLPSDRQVRSIYDTTRADITRLLAKKRKKSEELAQLGGSNEMSAENGQQQQQQQQQAQNSYTQGGFHDNPPTLGNPTPSSGFSDNPATGNSDIDDFLL